MPYRLFQDDKGKDSAMRVMFIVFMITTITLLTVILALMIREHLEEGKSLDDVFKWLTGGGVAAFFAKVFQKRYEVTNPKQKQPQAEKQPQQEVNLPEIRREIKIYRIFENENKTLGEGYVLENGRTIFEFKTLELPWKGNEPDVSRIPQGAFQSVAIIGYKSRKYGIHLMGVVGRGEIMIHVANYARQLRGCIAVGTAFKDLNADGIMDVEDSRKVMQRLEQIFPLDTKMNVTITDNF